MRISTGSIFDLGISAIQRQQADVLKAQQQVSTGRRILAPSDDPIASARALDVTQALSTNEQFATNRQMATSKLSQEDIILASLTTLIQDVKTQAVYAGNPTLDDNNRKTLASDLQGRYAELLSLANSADGNGEFLFAGYRSGMLPFAETSPGNVAYSGDQGQQLIQIGASRQLAVNDAGVEVFQNIKNGNGSFVTAAVSGNTGSGTISAGVVLDQTKWATSPVAGVMIKFAVDSSVPPVTTYDITDSAGTTSLLTGAAPTVPYPRTYSSGSTISLSQASAPAFDYGAQLSITGTPANGDTFTVKPSTSESLFTTLDNLIKALQVPGGGTSLTNSLNTALTNLDNADSHVLTIRASVGSRLNEIDAAQSLGEELNIQYKQTLSDLQDVDYAAAISELTRYQTYLEAAQKSYTKVTQLSLFNFL